MFGILLGLSAYTYGLTSVPIPTPGSVAGLVPVAGGYLALVFLGIGLVLYDLNRAMSGRVAEIRGKGVAPLAPGWIVPYVLSIEKYRRYFAVSTLLYGVFYAVITSMIVYQPTVDFPQAYGVPVPSAQLTPISAAPLLTPVLTVYVVNHFGILLVPFTVIFLVATSTLVGLNFALAGFALGSRAQGAGRGWVGGVGAVVGLFTGCPTCAGLFFANFLGGATAVSFAGLLGYYQPVFILLSIPVLLVAPYLTSRSLAKVYREGCVYLSKAAGPTEPP